MMKPSKQQDKVMATAGHLLVVGGPGSGKTTVSIFKAAQIVEHALRSQQNVLFLSFARATVSRVMEAIGRDSRLSEQHRRQIKVETYHAFFWRVLKAHGYLLGLPRKLSILLPQNEAVALSTVRSAYKAEKDLSADEKQEKVNRENEERNRLAFEEGRVCFSLFAELAGRLVHSSQSICDIIALMHPYIILDEFQDTNDEQWHIVSRLSQVSTMCALGDPEQRIYGWLGADPERLNHYRDVCAPEEVDFGDLNHRSEGTDIRLYGDDVLKRKFSQKAYRGVGFSQYECNKNQAYATLCSEVLRAQKRVIKNSTPNWTIAVLVPTKLMTRQVSDYLRSPPAGMPPVRHTAAVEMHAPILGSEIVAFLLQPLGELFDRQKFIDLVCSYFRGKGGDNPAKTHLQEADRIENTYSDYLARNADGRPVRRRSIVLPILQVFDAVRSLALTGNPDDDWLSVWRLMRDGGCKRLIEISEELRNVRLLDRGTQMRQSLADCWGTHGAYVDALDVVRASLVTEHFSMDKRVEKGVIVMNMHKAKGKQFDEVIIFEGWPIKVKGKIVSNPGRILRSNLEEYVTDQALQNLRVSITRGKQQVIIVTSKCDPCILLFEHKA